MRLVTLLLLFPLWLSITSASAAEDDHPAQIDPQTKAAAVDLMRLMGVEQKLQRMADVMRPAVTAMVMQKIPGPDGKQLVDNIIMPEFQAHTGELVDITAELYARRFTVEEMAQMRAFYETPVGAKLVREQDAMMVESQQLGKDWAQRLLPVIFREHADELAELVRRARERSTAPAK